MQNQLQINPETCHIAKHLLGEELYGKRILNVSKYILWSKVEYVIRLSGYLVISDNKLKAIYGSEKTFNRFDFDKKQENTFNRIGGYALNNIDLSELIFVEKLNCFIEKDYFFLLKNIDFPDLKETIWIENIDNKYHFKIGSGFKQYTSEFFA